MFKNKILIFKNKSINSNNIFKIPKFFQQDKLNQTVKYDKDKFEQEWIDLYNKEIEKQKEFINKDLNQQQKSEVDLLFSHLKNLNKYELKYFLLLSKNKYMNNKNVNPFTVNKTNPSTLVKSKHLGINDNDNIYTNPKFIQALDAFSGKISSKL